MERTNRLLLLIHPFEHYKRHLIRRKAYQFLLRPSDRLPDDPVQHLKSALSTVGYPHHLLDLHWKTAEIQRWEELIDVRTVDARYRSALAFAHDGGMPAIMLRSRPYMRLTAPELALARSPDVILTRTLPSAREISLDGILTPDTELYTVGDTIFDAAAGVRWARQHGIMDGGILPLHCNSCEDTTYFLDQDNAEHPGAPVSCIDCSLRKR